MVSIREYQYKKINNDVYIGLELEAKEENFYKNNVIAIEFFNEGKLVKTDVSTEIPTLIGTGIFYIGKELKIDFDFDDIKLRLELGEIEYETTFNETVKLEFDSMNLETRKISYKITNLNQETLSMAVLNLVFFNKGTLVGGTNLKLENLLNERVYYFEYEIPQEFEFTEVQPYLVLPSTNQLLFKGFYEKYGHYNNKIKELSTEIDEISYEEFVDETYTYDEKIKKEEVEIQKLNKKIIRSEAPVLKNNIKILLKNFKETFESYRYSDGIANKVIKFLTKASIVIGILFLLYGNGGKEFSEYDRTVWLTGLAILFLGIPVALFLIYYIPCYIHCCIFETKYDSKKKYMTLAEKTKKIKLQTDKIHKIKLEREEYIKSIDSRKKMIDMKNQEIEAKNDEIEMKNDEIFEERSKYQEMLHEMILKHPEYKAIQGFDQLDFEIVNEAINAGKYTFEEVNAERTLIRETIARIEKENENEEKMRQLEAEKRQEARFEAMRKELKQSEQRWKDEFRMQQHRAEAMQREMAQRQAWYQGQAQRDISKQLGRIAESEKQLEVYGESFYNKYH